jgi:hypothetical protein
MFELNGSMYKTSEFGNVTSKRNGVTRYRVSHALTVITIKSDNVSSEPRVITIRSYNDFHMPREMTVKSDNCDNAHFDSLFTHLSACNTIVYYTTTTSPISRACKRAWPVSSTSEGRNPGVVVRSDEDLLP